MRIRPIALCPGVAVTPGFALAGQSGYDVNILQNIGWGPGAINLNLASGINAFGKPPDTVPLPPATMR